MKKSGDTSFRVGMGYDIHAFGWDRTLMLGGVRIPSKFGLVGHSDADVLLHAICDALLGALGLGDIGKHFPDTSRRWKNASGLRLLKAVHAMIRAKGYRVVNVDTTIILEHPKLIRYKRKMSSNIAQVLDIPISSASVKATTHERLGSLGRSEGCAAMAVVLLRRL